MHFVNFRGNNPKTAYLVTKEPVDPAEILKCELCNKYSLPLSKLKNRKDGEKFLKKHIEKVHGKPAVQRCKFLNDYHNTKRNKTRTTSIPGEKNSKNNSILHPVKPEVNKQLTGNPKKEKLLTDHDQASKYINMGCSQQTPEFPKWKSDQASKYINASCSLCGFKSTHNYNYARITKNYKQILQFHMMKTHFKSDIEDTLPKISPFKCPESGCKTPKFNDFDSLFRHYHIHINLEKFVVFKNKHKQQQQGSSKSPVESENNLDKKSNSKQTADFQSKSKQTADFTHDDLKLDPKYKKSCSYCGFKPISNNTYR